MNEAQKDNVRKLVEALRTTTVPQGKGWLNIVSNTCTCHGIGEKVGMCCLGVACDQVPGIKKEVREIYTCSYCGGKVSAMTYGEVNGGHAASLPPEAQEFFGLWEWPELVAPVVGETGRHAATFLNDEARLSFPEIGNAFARTFLGEEV